MISRFENLQDGTFFRFPGRIALFRKIALRYESTKEVNVQANNNSFHFVNGPQAVVLITEDCPIPSAKDLKNE